MDASILESDDDGEYYQPITYYCEDPLPNIEAYEQELEMIPEPPHFENTTINTEGPATPTK